MSYRRALLFVDAKTESTSAITVLRGVAPQLEHLLVMVSPGVAREPIETATTDAARSVEVQQAPDLGHAAIVALCEAEAIDLVVFGSRSLRSASLVAAQRLPIAVLWADGKLSGSTLTHVGCIGLNARARLALEGYLRDHGAPTMHVTWLQEWRQQEGLDLVVAAQLPTALLFGAFVTTPVLFVPTVTSARPFAERAMDVADVIDDGGPLRVHIDQVAALGTFAPLADQAVSFAVDAEVIATITTRDGDASLPAGLHLRSVSVSRAQGSGDPRTTVERHFRVLRPEGPVALVDVELADEAIRAIAEQTDLIGVRLRPTRACGAIRKRLRALGATGHVIDARTVLDEGLALDVSDMVDAVRLDRVAEAMRRAGFSITRVVPNGPIRHPAPVASVTDGNRIALELDNATARRWLLEAIDQSRRTLHLQVYMALDDHIGRAVETALASAAARGVTVRVLVDSLHGLHGSFGARNPLLDRLATYPGVELRMLRPITELPSLKDLKQRDHRKLVVADGAIALLGGRNLSAEYYTAFEEARIHADSIWREVPWLDCGARLEGPAVADVERSFLQAWSTAGGAAYPIATPNVVGNASAAVVVHHGLNDARTLEAYRGLIDRARSHVYVVNGFPLVLELQHALLRALARGVRVQALIGHPAPTHDGQTFRGPWSTARTFATELVHSRIDPLIDAGGEAFLFARSGVPGWAPDLGIVHPHVHAKALSVDGQRCAVGSANLDVTASYWESELLLVIDDDTLSSAFEARLADLIAGSTRVRREDATWRALAQRRAWMRHWPGVLSA